MVTIIVTTYNDSEFLIKCLTSCVIQEITKEIILVDDCSTKSFSEELLKFIDKFDIKVIRRETNGGLSAARNTGISAAKYGLIIPLDADDIFAKNAVPKLVEHIDGNHHIFYGNVYDNTPSCKQWVKPKLNITKEEFLKDNPLFCSSLYKREIWKKNGGYTVRPHAHYEDYNFWAKAFALGYRFKYCDVNVYQHTYRPDSMLQQLHKDSAELKKLAIEGVF